MSISELLSTADRLHSHTQTSRGRDDPIPTLVGQVSRDPRRSDLQRGSRGLARGFGGLRAIGGHKRGS